MTVVFMLLLGLGVWQFTFVITAIESNVFLNATIFGTFFFGVLIAYRNIFTLDNEVLAFNALREDHEDASHDKTEDEAENERRHLRCAEKAIIFKKPKIIGQAYHIISEEIARTGKLNLSTGVIQNILDSVDDRIDEKKSLVQYVTGILVFLGLIGTFVGLMVTLGSVGMIIGGIDLSGDGGPDAIQGLMNDLQIPLEGMATGFSSSLFGLITSLALGLMTRFSNQSSNIFRAGFETWLAGLASIGSDSSNEGPNAQNPAQDRQLALMLRVARLSMISNTKLVSSVDNMVETTQRLIESQINTESMNALVAQSVSVMIDSHSKSNEILGHVAGTLEEREELRNIMGKLRTETTQQTHIYNRVNTALSEVVERQIGFHQQLAAKEEEFVLQAQLSGVVDSIDEKLSNEFSGLSMKVGRVDDVLAELENRIGSSAQDTQLKLSQLVSRSNDMHFELSNSIAENKAIMAHNLEIKDENEQVLKEDEQVSKEVSAMALQRRLYKHYGLTSQDLKNSEPEVAKKSKFNFFRRSA